MRSALLVICCLLTGTTPWAQALEIEFRYSGEAGEHDMLRSGMRAAADQWSLRLVDPVRLLIDVRIASPVEIGFAQALAFPVPEVVAYRDVRTALIADATSDDDGDAVGYLPEQDSLTFRANEPDGQIMVNQEQRGINGYLDVPRANAKALSLPVTGGPESADAEIVWNEFSLIFEFDFDRSDGITGSDFVGAAMHELGHALGFMSGVDDFDESSLPNGPFAPEDLREYAILNVPDLFRYSAESLPDIDLTFGGDPYFSIDGGQTPLGYFATGSFNGDGDQASHWKVGHGIMDSGLPISEIAQISGLDLRMMDVIGWDVAAVPEPSAFCLLVCGFLVMARVKRRKTRPSFRV